MPIAGIDETPIMEGREFRFKNGWGYSIQRGSKGRWRVRVSNTNELSSWLETREDAVRWADLHVRRRRYRKVPNETEG